MRNWPTHVWQTLASHKDATAFRALDEAQRRPALTTHGEWLREIQRAAIGLIERGFPAGARLGLITPNTREALTLTFAAWLAGGCVMPVAPGVDRRTALRCLGRSGCEWIVVRDASALEELRDPRLPAHLQWITLRDEGVVANAQTLTWAQLMESGKYREIRGGDRTLKERAFNTPSDAPALVVFEPEPGDDPHGAFFSGVKLAHQLKALGEDMGLGEADRLAVVVSMGWFHAALMGWATLVAGRALVDAPTLGGLITSMGTLSPTHLLCNAGFLASQSARWRAQLEAAPEYLKRMREGAAEDEGLSLTRMLGSLGERAARQKMYEPIREGLGEKLRVIYVIDGALPEGVEALLKDMEIEALGVFGVPEAGVTHIEREGAQRDGAAGRPVQGVACKIDGAKGEEVGEVLVRSELLFDGYWDGSGPRHRDAEGWLHTGRRGHLSSGFLFLEAEADEGATGDEG